MLNRITKEELGVEQHDLSDLPKEFLNPGELDTLITLVKSENPKTMLEIGCNTGRTAKAILDNVPSLKSYVGVDVNLGYMYEKWVQRRETPPEPGILAKSNPKFSLWVSERGSFDYAAKSGYQPFDVVFIDGDHSRKALEHDTQLAANRVGRRGMIIWHDYHSLGTVDVKPFIDELASTYSWAITHVVGTWLVYAKF